MLECLIIGDSIAVGISQYLKQCELQGKIGITSSAYSNTYVIKQAKETIISLGSNDLGYDPYESMKVIRDRIDHKVIWLISANSKTGALSALKLAKEYGDNVIRVDSVEMSSDNVHPTTKGLKKLSELIE
jgi:hypothetical protein